MGWIVDALYLFFAAVSLYMLLLFFLLFIPNRKKIFSTVSASAFPTLSILIPAYNEEKTIASTIKAVRRMDYPKPVEIIVIDDGSTDSTAAKARAQGVLVLRKKNGGKASALNFGLKYAKGELVACVDADAYPAKDALLKAIPHFYEDPKVAAVTTSIFVKEGDRLIRRLQRIEYILIIWARKLLEQIDAVYVTPGPLSLYKRSILNKVGGFDEKNMTEDIEIAFRLIYHGYKIKMALDANVETNAPSSVLSWWRQRIRWNLGGMQTAAKYLHTFAKKDFHSLGLFVVPLFTSSYFVAILGFALFAYVLLNWIYLNAAFILRAPAFGVDPFQHLDVLVLPDVFSVFGLFILALSLVWVRLSLSVVKRPLEWPGTFLDLFLYLAFYVTVFPINLIYSVWKYLTYRGYRWYR